MARKHLYGYFRFVDKDGKEHFRKPTPKQRKNILIYYLRRRSGRCMRVADIAAAFHVSERTMQKLLRVSRAGSAKNQLYPIKERPFTPQFTPQTTPQFLA